MVAVLPTLITPNEVQCIIIAAIKYVHTSQYYLRFTRGKQEAGGINKLSKILGYSVSSRKT